MDAHVSGSGKRGNCWSDASGLAGISTCFALFGSLSAFAQAVETPIDMASSVVGPHQWEGYRDGLFGLGLADGRGQFSWHVGGTGTFGHYCLESFPGLLGEWVYR